MLLKTATAYAMTEGQIEPKTQSQLDIRAVGTRSQTDCIPGWVCSLCWTEVHLQGQKQPSTKTCDKDTKKSKTLNPGQRKIFVVSPAVSLEMREHMLQCANKVRKICKAQSASILPCQASGKQNCCWEVSTVDLSREGKKRVALPQGSQSCKYHVSQCLYCHKCYHSQIRTVTIKGSFDLLYSTQ